MAMLSSDLTSEGLVKTIPLGIIGKGPIWELPDIFWAYERPCDFS